MADKYYDMGAMQAFYDKIKTLFQTVANKVTSWSSTPSDSKYPSEKLVKTSLDAISTNARTIPQDISKGANLVVNGSGRMTSNYNFSSFSYVPTISYGGSAGSFGYDATNAENEYISCDFNKKVVFSADVKNLVSQPSNCIHRVYVLEFDIDKKSINAIHVMYGVGTLTELTQDLNPGDTVVHLADLSNANWLSATTYHRGFIFWNYQNSYGYLYPPETYSRNVYPSENSNPLWDVANVNVSAGTITLNSGWTGPAIPAGTKVSRRSSGNMYPYPTSVTTGDTEWHSMKGYMKGITSPGTSERSSTKFSQGTAFIRAGIFPSNLNNTDPVINKRAVVTNFAIYEEQDINDGFGTLPVNRGGTGKTSVTAGNYLVGNGTSALQEHTPMAAANNMLSALPDWTANPTDGVKLIRRDTAGGASFGQVTFLTVWNYIISKISSVLGLTATSYGGNAATASAAESGSALETAINSKANESEGVYYVAGSSDYVAYSASSTYTATTSSGPFTSENSCTYSGKAYFCKTTITTPEAWNSSHWTAIATPVLTGTIDGLTSLYAGLKIAYKMSITGGTSSTYLNINNLGNKYIRRNDSNLTTHLPANTVVFLAYDGTYWHWADYDSNTNNWVTTMGAYCETAAATQAKTATSTNTVYTAGEAFLIRIVNANTYNGKITLNINSQGAKDVWINGAVSSSSNKTLPAGEHWCYYDGSVFHIWTDGTAEFKKLKAENLDGNASTASEAQAGSELESELNSKVDASELADLSLNATYLESNRRLVFDDIVFDNIYPMLGKYGLATFPEDTTVAASAFSGDKDWLLDWRPYLIDMTPVAGETGKKPVAELMRNNWLRKTDGEYAPVCGITAAQSAALNGKKDTLYWKTGSAGDKVSATISTAFDSSGNFVPSAFWEYVKANLSTVNTKAGVTYAAPIEVKVYVGSHAYEFGSYTEYHIPAPWETTETKYSVFIGRNTDVYLVDGYSETTGEHMRGLTAKPVPVGSKEFDPEFFKLRRTGISPGPSTTVGNKTRNFFYNYNGTDSYTKGNAGSLSILVNNGTYPRTCDASQYTTANWARSNNSGGSSGNAVPVGEGGYHSLNAFLCSVEAAYQTRNICASTAFGTGNSSNDACNNAATYRTNGGFMLTYNGSTTYHAISADLKSRLGTSSSVYVYNVINNQYAHFQCMEPQIAASLAAEMGIAANIDFKWNGGTWHYETPSAFTVTDLSNGRMNCRIYKDIAFSDKSLGGVSGCSGSVNLRCSLIEGMNTVGDIWWYQGGGAELIYMTDGTGNTNYKYSFYLEPDQTKWNATSTDEKHTNGSLFTCESAYRCLIEDSTAGTLGNTYCLSRTGYTPVRRSNGGSIYTGECCHQYRQIDDDAKGSSGIRSRRNLRFRGYANNSSCSPRSLSAYYRPSYTYAHIGCSAQVLLQ